MYERHIIGKIGEEKASNYLINSGYRILERNFSCRQGEIDIIAFDGKYTVFFEIKARTNLEYGLPSEAVNKRKMKHMLNAIKYYLYIHKIENTNIRIDVIEVYACNDEYRINHLKQVL